MAETVPADLKKWLDEDPKRFEVITKHYYDLFAYHAAQRLTTFNFFIVSLSFFSNAYATLIAKGDDSHRFYYVMAGILSFTAWSLVVTFSRLDKRNEQIILINEGPLKRVQIIIAERFGGDEWETFRHSNEQARPLRTFGKLLPIIYVIAGTLAAAGCAYGLLLGALLSTCVAFVVWLALMVTSIAAVKIAGPARGSAVARPSGAATGSSTLPAKAP
jgi:hypothetical protein